MLAAGRAGDYSWRPSDRDAPKDFAEALDHNWSVFALPDFFRAMSLTLKYFSDRKVRRRVPAGRCGR